MNLRADAVELVFGEEGAAGHGFDGDVGGFLWGCEHELEGVEEAEFGVGETIIFGQEGDFVEVAEEEVGALDFLEGCVEGVGDGGLKNSVLNAGAHVVENYFCEIGGFAGMSAAM